MGDVVQESISGVAFCQSVQELWYDPVPGVSSGSAPGQKVLKVFYRRGVAGEYPAHAAVRLNALVRGKVGKALIISGEHLYMWSHLFYILTCQHPS